MQDLLPTNCNGKLSSREQINLIIKSYFQYSLRKEVRQIMEVSNTQVPSSDVITSLCGYSSVNEAWKVFVYVNGGASAIGDA